MGSQTFRIDDGKLEQLRQRASECNMDVSSAIRCGIELFLQQQSVQCGMIFSGQLCSGSIVSIRIG